MYVHMYVYGYFMETIAGTLFKEWMENSPSH